MFLPDVFSKNIIHMAGQEVVIETNIKDSNDILKLKDHFTKTSFTSFTVVKTNYKTKGYKEIQRTIICVLNICCLIYMLVIVL